MKNKMIVFAAAAACLAAALLFFAYFADARKIAAVSKEKQIAVNGAEEEKQDAEGCSLEELFFYHEIGNGYLLATANGSMGEQLERAAVFVPPGGGGGETAVRLIVSDDSHIVLEEDGLVTEYHLYRLSGDDALIIKYEPEKTFSLIKYSADEDSFKQAEASEYFPGHLGPHGSFSMDTVSVTDKTAGRVYLWEDGRFIAK